MNSRGAATEEPMLGLVMPVDPEVPPEAAAMYPTGIRFQAASVGLKTMTPKGYDEVLERIAPAAKAAESRAPRWTRSLRKVRWFTTASTNCSLASTPGVIRCTPSRCKKAKAA